MTDVAKTVANSAQPCGCDPGANYLCERHMRAAATPQVMQAFGSGAVRSADNGKIDYEGFLSMPALERFGLYMLKHQKQADGQIRPSDNWKKGIPIFGPGGYLKALLRHTLELVGLSIGHRSVRIAREMPNATRQEMFEETACAVFFNIQGILHEMGNVDPLAEPTQPAQKVA